MADRIQCPKCNASIFANVQFCPKCGEKIRVQEFRKENIGDLYKILQVDPSAEPEVIEGAYKRLAAKYHPDVNKSADAQTRMQEINRAYQVLSKEESRRQYDLTRETKPDEARKREAETSEKQRQEEAKKREAMAAEKQRQEEAGKREAEVAAKRTGEQKKQEPFEWLKWGAIFSPIAILGIGGVLCLFVIIAIISKPTQSTASPTLTPRPTARPTNTKRPTQTAIVKPDCYQWSEITSSMIGKDVCAYGKVVNLTSNQQTFTRIEFSNQPNTFFMYSANYTFYDLETGKSLAIEDCIYSFGKIDDTENVLYMDIGTGEELYRCETWMLSPSVVQPGENTQSLGDTKVSLDNLRTAVDMYGKNLTKIFSPTDKVYAIVDLENASTGTVIEVFWFAEHVEGIESDKKIYEHVMDDFTDESYTGIAYFPIWWEGGDGFPVGKYRVDIYLNGTYKQSTSFSVRH